MCEREVEAVARDAIAWIRDGFPLTAAKLQERLDRVRDARGDDEADRLRRQRNDEFNAHSQTLLKLEAAEAARSPQDENHECIYESDADGDLACPVCSRYADSGDEAADAQDEDHEAGIKAAWQVTREAQSMTRGHIEAIIAAYLSRVRPPQGEDHEGA